MKAKRLWAENNSHLFCIKESKDILEVKEKSYVHANFSTVSEWGYFSQYSDKLRAGRRINRSVNAAGAGEFSLLQSVGSGAGANVASYSARMFSRGLNGRSKKLTTRVHLVKKLRMSGVTTQLSHVPSCFGFSLSTGNKRNRNRARDS